MRVTFFGLLTAICLMFPFYSLAQDLNFTMEIVSAKSKSPVLMKVSSSQSMVAIEPQFDGSQGTMRVLIDNNANKQFMLMEHNGQKMAMSIPASEIEKAGEKTNEPKITVTKDVKTINGYKCTRIIAETQETISDVWVTSESGLNYSDLYKIFSSSKGHSGASRSLPQLKNVKGFPIEIISTDKTKDESVTVRIKNINRAKPDPEIFSMDGFKVMDMPKMSR